MKNSKLQPLISVIIRSVFLACMFLWVSCKETHTKKEISAKQRIEDSLQQLKFNELRTCTSFLLHPKRLRYNMGTLTDSSLYFFAEHPKLITPIKIELPNFYADMLVLDSTYIVLTTDRHTMKRLTKDYLHKYDKDWNLLWTKEIDIPKIPSGNSFLRLNEDKTTFLYTTERWNQLGGRTTSFNLLARQYNLEGEILTNNLYHNDPDKNIHRLKTCIPLKDSTTFITADVSPSTDRRRFCRITNLDAKGKLIWTTKIDSFYPQKTIQLHNRNLILLGKNKFNQEIHLIKTTDKGELVWRKKMEGVAKGIDIIELTNGNCLFLVLKKEKDQEDHHLSLLEIDASGNVVLEENNVIEYSGYGAELFYQDELLHLMYHVKYKNELSYTNIIPLIKKYQKSKHTDLSIKRKYHEVPKDERIITWLRKRGYTGILDRRTPIIKSDLIELLKEKIDIDDPIQVLQIEAQKRKVTPEYPILYIEMWTFKNRDDAVYLASKLADMRLQFPDMDIPKFHFVDQSSIYLMDSRLDFTSRDLILLYETFNPKKTQ